MQILKGDRNSQLKKNEATHVRKSESPRKYGTKAKKQSSVPCAPSMVRNYRRNPWPVDTVGTMGVPVGSRATTSQKKTGERERPRIRCQGPAQGQNTNDDDDIELMLP